jgi:hypothetical protein
MRTVAIVLLLAGCSGVATERQGSNKATITFAKQPNGTKAVAVFYYSWPHLAVREVDPDAQELRFKPRRYSLYLNCYRPGALIILDGTDRFDIDLADAGTYVLDCAPVDSRNNFSIKRADDA